MTNSERQRQYKAGLARDGLVQCNVIIPADAVADFKALAELIRAHPHLVPSCARDPQTGILVGLKSGLRKLHNEQRKEA